MLGNISDDDGANQFVRRIKRERIVLAKNQKNGNTRICNRRVIGEFDIYGQRYYIILKTW